MSKPKTVFLDAYTLNPGDLDISSLESVCDLKCYDRTSKENAIARCKDATIVITNKFPIDKLLLKSCPNLKFIQVAATGFNNIDLKSTQEMNIRVANVKGYSSSSVAQHVFAVLLSHLNKVAKYNAEVKEGLWSAQDNFSYYHESIIELKEKTLGIIGLGNIGKTVAKIGLAFGMKVIAYHKYPQRDKISDVGFEELDAVLMKSDFLSLHAPLNPQTFQLINKKTLKKMQKHAILINTARGDLINEQDLKDSLEKRDIAAALLDVLTEEPPSKDHILIGVDNCFITPHQAWSSLESRKKLLDEMVKNIVAFQKGIPRNLIGL